MSGFHPPSPGPEPTPTSAARRRRPSLASLKAEVYQRLGDEDAEAVADDLLARAKEGVLPAIQLLLLYTIGHPPDWDTLDIGETVAEPIRGSESEAPPCEPSETVPPTVAKRTCLPVPAVTGPSSAAGAIEAHRPQTALRDPGRPPSDRRPRTFDAGAPSPNGCVAGSGATGLSVSVVLVDGTARRTPAAPRIMQPAHFGATAPSANGHLAGTLPGTMVARSPPSQFGIAQASK